MKGRKITLKQNTAAYKAGVFVVVASLFLAPSAARAQMSCESTPEYMGYWTASVATVSTALITHYTALSAGELLSLKSHVHTPVLNKLDDVDNTQIIGRLTTFWNDFHESLKDMTKQLTATLITQNLIFGQSFDVAGINRYARAVEKEEEKAKKMYQPSGEDCVFDTQAKYMTAISEAKKELAKGFTGDASQLGNNMKGTPAAQGPSTVQKSRWDIYVRHFCDPNANAKHAGCTVAGDNMNAHISPSKTFFGKYTVDLKDEKTKAGVSELMFNLTGYEVPQNILSTGSAGIEQRMQNRSYLTQMDTIVAPVADIIADRASMNISAPEIKEMRVRASVPGAGDPDASDKPSEREVRQSVIERLWDPRFYAAGADKADPATGKTEVREGLSDIPYKTVRKEVYLQAYNNMLLYHLIEKTEKISNIYAIETANILQKNDISRSAGIENIPAKGN